MKTMYLTGIRQIEIQDIPKPGIEKETDVLVKMGSVGICGSDVHYYLEGKTGNACVKYPWTVGHECAGTVEEVGTAVKGLKPGDRVAIEPAISCLKCDQCLSGRPNTCRELKFISSPSELPGGLKEYIVIPEENCFKIPDAMTLEQAALSEPLSIGLYAVKQSLLFHEALLSNPPSPSVVILGSGPIGLCSLLSAMAMGITKNYVTDKIQARLDTAQKAGAIWTGNPDKDNICAEIAKLEPLQPDIVIECAGEQDAIDQAFEILKPGGKLMILGIPKTNTFSFDLNSFRRREIAVYYVRRQRGCVQEALELITDGKVDTDFMVTHRFDLDHVQDAFDLVADYGDGVIKAMINF